MTEIFGSQDEGSGGFHVVVTGPGYIVGTVFTLSENGDANSISAFISYGAAFGFISADIRCAIYKHGDLSFVAETEEKHVVSPASAYWETFNFDTPPELTGSTDYILVCWATAQGTVGPFVYLYHAGDSASDVSHTDQENFNGFPNPLDPTHQDNTDAIYCTYEVAPSGTNTKINIGDAWKDIAAMKINISDAWKDVAAAKINIGDAWKAIF